MKQDTMDSTVEEAVTRFLDAQLAGKHPDRKAFLDQLATTRQRQDFEELLRFALTVDSFPPTVFAPGAICGPYRIDKKLGEGGFGSVWQAHDTTLDCDVAIKTLPAEKSGSEIHAQRLDVEAKLLAKLKHPNIVTVHTAGEAGGVRYLVMDLIDGPTLASVIDRLQATPCPTTGHLLAAIERRPRPGRPPLFDERTSYWVAVARIFRDTCRAVAAAHSIGILHRDVKPANIMLEGGGHPVVLDFGLAGSPQVEAGPVTQRLVGSIPYLAPEQVSKSSIGYDPRSDVYQLGVCFYELLVLRRAFPPESITKMLQDIRTGRLKPPRRLRPDVPPELEAICLTATEVDPERRFATAAEMADDLERWLSGKPILCRPPTPLRRASLFVRRNWTSVGTAAGALLVGLAIWLWFPRLLRVEAPQLEPFVWTGTEAKPTTEVRPGETIGVEVDVPKRTFLLAISVSGAGEGRPERMRPLRPQHEMDATDGRPHLLSLREGRQRVLLATVKADTTRRGSWYEGVWVFRLDARHKALEDWLAAMDSERAGSDLPMERAMALLLDALQPMRGEDPKLGAEDLAALRQACRDHRLGFSDYWPIEDLKPDIRWFRVLP